MSMASHPSSAEECTFRFVSPDGTDLAQPLEWASCFVEIMGLGEWEDCTLSLQGENVELGVECQ